MKYNLLSQLELLLIRYFLLTIPVRKLVEFSILMEAIFKLWSGPINLFPRLYRFWALPLCSLGSVV
jgi:hypothetical protein